MEDCYVYEEVRTAPEFQTTTIPVSMVGEAERAKLDEWAARRGTQAAFHDTIDVELA